ncbi:hypothetical protein IAR55_005852 [Kwoniella newhampshirensis]|uniref:Helicase ATP-binding domain-containing protein n=1 Tax=Kwoniella newhampshirensis TaxID=1651941 RepID=A0AAW0YJY4_9TREE
MTTAFPTTSSHSVELAYPDYDIDQLVKAVDGAIKDKDKYAAHQTSSDPSHFHLHTCTIETALFPPKPTIPYHNRPDQPNPAYEYFTSVREKVAATVGPFSPLTITSPSSNSIRPGYQFQRSYGSGRTSFYGTKVYLPGAHNKTHLAMLSPLPNTARYEWSPTSKAWDLEHWLQTIFALDPKIDANRKSVYRDDKKRFHLGTGLQICWVPDGDGPDAGIELKLLITIDVFVDMNAIYTSLPDVGNDLVGFVLHSLLHSPTSVQATSESEARAAGLRHFYSTLRPAPDLPFNYSARQLQPKEMVSRLLPFQTRTLRLLLQREQAENLSQDFKPVRSDPVGFWKGYDLGENFGRVGYRRLTGDLTKVGLHRPIKVDRKGKGRAYDQTPESVPDDLDEKDRENLPVLLDLSGVRGTMLCEEMGLGKTVEAIALILLHRHPLSHSRSSTATTIAQNGETSKIGSRQNGRVDKEAVPVIDLIKGPPGLEDEAVHKWATDEGIAFESRQAWDDNAKLNVTEVATTLIVTPPSLLKQWVSEMQRHAPSLRICVYEGWKSLQRGVEKQRAARLKAQGVKAQAEKKRKNAQFRNQTRKKYAKSKGGDRIKQESDNEDDDDVIATQASVVEEEGTLQVTQRQFVEYVRAHDVVITTYGQDLKVATPAPPRSRRSTAKYQPNERPRSPLVMVEWWRVIMDEVQLHGDQTDAANMVSLIPRKNSLAVSGTPARTDVKDLLGSLRFLRVPVLPNDNGYDHRLWHRLQQPSWRPAFEGLFRSIAVRTTKKEVAGEFNLPHQSRYVVPIELSQIELHYYNDTLQRTRERLHLPADPKEARPPDWVLDRTLFRTCLQALRQICTHIQVGQMQAGVGRGDQRLHLGRSLMTMTEALNKMIHDHTAEYLVETRQQMRAMIRKAQLTMLDNNNDLRYLTAANMGPVREHLKQLLGGKDDTSESGREASPEKHQSQQDKERHAVLTATRQT